MNQLAHPLRGRSVLRRAALLLLACVALTACAHTRRWRYGDLDACITKSQDVALERQRSYLALRLALHARGVKVVDADEHGALLAEYPRGRDTVRWLIELREDGSLHVAPAPGSSASPAESEMLFDTLGYEHVGYRCRDEAWLRKTAAERGVVRMPPLSGVAAVADADAQEGERNAALARAQYKAEVQRALDRTPIWPTASVMAGAGVSAGAGAGLMVWGFAYPTTTCDGDQCSSPSRIDRVRIIAGFSLLAVGLVTAGVTLPHVRRARAERRVLRHTLRYVQGAEVVPVQTGALFSLRGRF